MKKTKLNYPYFAHLLASFLLICSAALFFSACSEDDDVPIPEEDGVWDSPLRGSIATDDKVDKPAVVLGEVPSDMKEALDIRFTHLQNEVNEETDVLFLSGSSLSAYNDEIVTVYENGGIIVIVRPETAVANDWFEQIGWLYRLDETEKELYAFSQNHQYTLDKAYEEITVNEHLNYFVKWVNDCLKPILLSPPGSEETAIDKLTSAQTITHTFSYNLKVKETTPLAGDPDYIDGKGNFTAKYSIYSLYAFEGQPSNGDYYIVSAEYTTESANMCPVENADHRWEGKHWLKNAQLGGFFLASFNVETFLCAQDKNTRVGKFPVNYSPTPLTSQGATSYTSGMSWNLGGEMALGLNSTGPNGSATIKGGVTFSNSQSRTISDVDILNITANNAVKYQYKVNNLPRAEAGHISEPPLVSVANAILFSSWIWTVPGTKDRSTEQFYIASKPSFSYKSCHLYTSAADYEESFHSPEIEDDKVQYTSILPPNRTPTGLLSITNNNKGEYISDVVIRNEKGDVEYSSSGKGSIAKDNAFLRYIPTGRYSIEFKMGPNAHSTKTYVLADEYLTIVRGETLSLNSAFDFEEKK